MGYTSCKDDLVAYFLCILILFARQARLNNKYTGPEKYTPNERLEGFCAGEYGESKQYDKYILSSKDKHVKNR
jgi:hypothetical protein